MKTISMQYTSISKPDKYVYMNTKDVHVMDKNVSEAKWKEQVILLLQNKLTGCDKHPNV